MSAARFTAAIFPQHTRAGADAVMDALKEADADAAEHQRVLDENAELRCRIDELEAHVAELEERIEEYEWDHTRTTGQRYDMAEKTGIEWTDACHVESGYVRGRQYGERFGI